MTKITCTDLKDEKYSNMLVHHLESDDFFDVKNNPEATFIFTSSQPTGNVRSGPNLHISGELTIRGTTQPITLDAGVFDKGGELAVNSHFDIDRSRWNIKYGSEKFFALLGMHIVSDTISFEAVLSAKKE